MIRHTSTQAAPWHVVPADHKWFARVVIGSAIVSALDRLDLHFPKVDKADRSEFKQVREALLAEEKGRGGGEEAGCEHRCELPTSFPAKAGNPVRRGLSAQLRPLEYWVTRQCRGLPTVRVTAGSIRSPFLTIFWHCGRP